MSFLRPQISTLQLHCSSRLLPIHITSLSNRSFTSSSPHSRQSEEDELRAARSWLQRLNAETIPKTIGELSFSRSSGPGGQNVNKVSSKATLKIPLTSLLPYLPALLHPSIRSSRYIAPRSSAIVIQADDSRKQSDNAQACWKKLWREIEDVGRRSVPGETSEGQKERVVGLQKAENQRRMNTKKYYSAKKSSRRTRGDD